VSPLIFLRDKLATEPEAEEDELPGISMRRAPESEPARCCAVGKLFGTVIG
jgi:hypothetical protein